MECPKCWVRMKVTDSRSLDEYHLEPLGRDGAKRAVANYSRLREYRCPRCKRRVFTVEQEIPQEEFNHMLYGVPPKE